MFDRLKTFRLLGRLDGAPPSLIVQAGVALVLMTVVAVARLAIDAVTAGVAPFSLLYPAILAATLMAGWVSGALLTLAGGTLVWLFVMDRSGEGALRPSDAVSLGLFVVASAAIVALAEAFRRNARMRARQQAELAESEARLGLATSAAQVGVWEWRLAAGEMIYSPEARAICGFPAHGPVSYDMVASVTHPEDFPRTSAQAARALDPDLRDEQPYEYRLLLASGEERWVLANGQAIFETVDGRVTATRYVGTLQDITARKLAEAARAEAAARLRLSVDAGRMAVWQVDAERGVTPSPELNRMLGFPEDARPSIREFAKLNLPGELERVREIAQAAQARGERHFEAGLYLMRFAPGGKPEDRERWVVVGDVPPMHFETDDIRTPAVALQLYCAIAQDWADNVVAGRDLSDSYPIDAEPKLEHAEMLLSRIDFIRRELIPLAQ